MFDAFQSVCSSGDLDFEFGEASLFGVAAGVVLKCMLPVACSFRWCFVNKLHLDVGFVGFCFERIAFPVLSCSIDESRSSHFAHWLRIHADPSWFNLGFVFVSAQGSGPLLYMAEFIRRLHVQHRRQSTGRLGHGPEVLYQVPGHCHLQPVRHDELLPVPPDAASEKACVSVSQLCVGVERFAFSQPVSKICVRGVGVHVWPCDALASGV
jgi:hypothetical protein